MEQGAYHRSITAHDFDSLGFPSGKRYELADGQIRGRYPSPIADRLGAFLNAALQGSGHRSCSALRIEITDTDVCCPDIAVVGAVPESRCHQNRSSQPDPVVIFDILPASGDASEKRLLEYRQFGSLDTIVFVDPEAEATRVIQRLGPTSWRDDLFAQPHDVVLPVLGVTIPHTEIFARD